MGFMEPSDGIRRLASRLAHLHEIDREAAAAVGVERLTPKELTALIREAGLIAERLRYRGRRFVLRDLAIAVSPDDAIFGSLTSPHQIEFVSCVFGGDRSRQTDFIIRRLCCDRLDIVDCLFVLCGLAVEHCQIERTVTLQHLTPERLRVSHVQAAELSVEDVTTTTVNSSFGSEDPGVDGDGEETEPLAPLVIAERGDAGWIDIADCRFDEDLRMAKLSCEGAFRLRNSRAGGRVDVDSCRFTKGALFDRLTIDRDFVLHGSLFEDNALPAERTERAWTLDDIDEWATAAPLASLVLRNLRIKGGFAMRRDAAGAAPVASENVALIECTVGGEALLSLEQAPGENDVDRKAGLAALRCRFDRDVTLEAIWLKRGVAFEHCSLGPSLKLVGQVSDHCPLVSMRNCSVEGIVDLRRSEDLERSKDDGEHPFRFRTAFSFRFGRAGAFAFENVHLWREDGHGFEITDSQCPSGLRLDVDSLDDSSASLARSRFGGVVSIGVTDQDAKAEVGKKSGLPHLDLEQLHAEALELRLRAFTGAAAAARPELNLSNVSVTTFSDNVAECQTWKVKSRGLRFSFLRTKDSTRAGGRNDEIQTCDHRKRWLNGEECESEPTVWMKFVRGYDELGMEDCANHLFAEIRGRRSLRIFEAAADKIASEFSRYGYDLNRTICYCIFTACFFGILWSVFIYDACGGNRCASQSGVLVMTKTGLYPPASGPGELPPGYPALEGFVLALDLMVPVANLGMADHWEVNTSFGGESTRWTGKGTFFFVVRAANEFVGLVLFSFIVASLARLILRGKTTV